MWIGNVSRLATSGIDGRPLLTPGVETMGIYEWLLRPILFRMDPEEAHHFTQGTALKLSAVWPRTAGLFRYEEEDLQVSLAGIALDNPVGLAAGFDKNAMLVGILGHVGFAFAEVGS